jgi:hypothetical protein
MPIKRITFDYSYLLSCIEKDEAKIDLNKNYTNLTRNINIDFQCKCTNFHTKVFRQIHETGALCKKCTEKQKQERRESTCLKIHGETHASKNKTIVEKANNTFRKNLLEKVNPLTITHSKLIQEWNYEKNIGLKPEEYTAGSGVSVWWKCDKICDFGCKHEWEAVISSRTISESGCPYCSKHRICIHNSIVHTNPDIVREWNYEKNMGFNPEYFSKYSDQKVWWKCPITCPEGCPHEWESTIGNRTNGNGCPYCCSFLKKCCKHTSIISTHPNLMKQWNPKNKDLGFYPEEFTFGSHNKVWWKCEKNHEWEAIIYSRVTGNGCPHCNPKFSKQQLEWLKYHSISYPGIITIESSKEYFIEDIGKIDGFHKETNTVFEYEGDFWHGNPSLFKSSDINPRTKTSYGFLYKKTQERIQKLNKLGYNVIEVWERDWIKGKKAILFLQKLWKNQK